MSFVGIVFSLLIEFSEHCSFPNTSYMPVTFPPHLFFGGGEGDRGGMEAAQCT